MQPVIKLITCGFFTVPRGNQAFYSVLIHLLFYSESTKHLLPSKFSKSSCCIPSHTQAKNKKHYQVSHHTMQLRTKSVSPFATTLWHYLISKRHILLLSKRSYFLLRSKGSACIFIIKNRTVHKSSYGQGKKHWLHMKHKKLSTQTPNRN